MLARPKSALKSLQRILIQMIVVSALVAFGQNCSRAQFDNQAAPAPERSTGGGSGDGFDGKVYAHAGLCGSVSAIDAKIWVSADLKTARFLRRNCEDIKIGSGANIIDDLDLSSRVAIVYKPDHVAFVPPEAPLNMIYMASPATFVSQGGVAMNLDISMTAIPMGVEGFQLCVAFLDSRNQALPVPNCFWPYLRSDIAQGAETFRITPTLPAGTPPGRYSIAAFYARWDSVKFVTVPMTMGLGVTPSPQTDTENGYIIGTTDLQ